MAVLLVFSAMPIASAEGDLSFLSWNSVYKESFSGAGLSETVHGRNGWTVAGEGNLSNMTAKIAENPSQSSDFSLQLERTASGEYAATTYSFADSAEEELTGKLYISADFYVNTWSSFELQVQTSNTTPLLRAYLTSEKAWRNNAGWSKIGPQTGTFSDNAWFTLGILMDTAAGTYDLYLNDAALTGGKMTKQGSAALLKTNRGVGKIKFDIDQGQSSGKFFVDNIVVKSENASGEEQPPEHNDVQISGKEVYMRRTFSLTEPSGLGETVVGGGEWNKRNIPVNQSLLWTLEQDPDNSAGLPFSKTNQVLRARRVRQGSANEWAYAYLKAGTEVVEARGEVHLKFKIKQEYADNNFILRVRNNAGSDAWGNELINCAIRPSGTVLDLSTWQGIGSMQPKKWNTMEFVLNTEAKTFDLYINGSKSNSQAISFVGGGSYDCCVSVFEWDIDKRSNGENVWYMDDLEIWTDHTAELEQAAKQLKDVLQGGEVSSDITLPQLDLGELYTVKWSSSNPEVISNDGIIKPRAYRQQARLTAEITRNADVSYTEQAKVTCSFDFTVLPKSNTTDEELLEELKNTYYTDSFLTQESLQSVTKALHPVPATGPEGVSAVLESNDEAINAVTGAVTRPEAGEEARQVTLTLHLTKNEVSAEKVFQVTVLPKETDSALLAEAETWLKREKLTLEDYSSLKYGLLLPTVAPNGTLISWSSDHPEIIAANGKVYRKNENVSVVLTATLSSGTESKSMPYSFTVLLSPQKMVEMDTAKIALSPENLDAVTDSFSVVEKGALYQSDIVWSSNNSNVIKIENGSAIVNQPLYEEGDAQVVMTAFVRNENASMQKTFTVVVPALPSDEDLVQTVKDWLNWNLISLDDIDDVKRNLALPNSYNGGVTISWESSNENVVLPDGRVYNPSIGENAVEVTLKATIEKNNCKQEKTFSCMVPPFTSIEEVLKKTKDNLSFSSLGGEDIHAVTNHLILPKNGAGGTQISWSSSDMAHLSILEESDRYIGLVTQPAIGDEDAYVTLTANISYGSKNVEKSFAMTVKATEEWKTIYQHSYEQFQTGELPTNEGEAVWPTEAYLSYRVAEDPTGEENKVALMYRAANAPHVVNESWYFYRHKNGALYDGEMIFSGRMYLDETLKETIWLDIVAKNGSQICMGFYADGKIGCQYTDGGVVTAFTKEPVLKHGQWMDFSIHMDSTTKTYHVFLDGECVTENGKLMVNGATVSLPWGVHYNYYQDSSRSTQIQGWRIYYLGTNGATDAYAYLDDISLKQKQTQNAKLLEAKANVERDLLALIRPDSVMESFSVPSLSSGNVKLKWYSSDASVLRSDGTVMRGETDQKVTLTAELTLGAETICRPFDLTVKSIYTTEKMTDEEIVQADLQKTVQTLQKSCNLSAVTSDLELLKKGYYGSELTWESSDEALLSDNGKVQGKSGGSLVLTVTAVKGNASAQTEIAVTLKAKSESSVSRPMTVSGNNSVGNTGIVLPPITEHEEKVFSDLPKEHWAHTAVMKLKEKHVLQGTDDEHFEPDRPITRAEFAKMVVAAFELIPVSTDIAEFTDVKKTDWYYQYVRTLSALGLIQGFEDGSFGVHGAISRQDMAVILYRVLKHQGFDLSEEITETADWDAIAEYAQEAVGCLISSDVLKGDENGNYFGQTEATRAQAAVLLYNCLNFPAKVK